MSEVPASVFKYLTRARLDIIENEKICFTPPDRFNDLLDVRPHVVPITSRAYLQEREKEAQRMFIGSLPPDKRPKTKKELKRFIAKYASGGIEFIQGQATELARKYERELPNIISQHFGVLCLSEARDEHLLWAHYTEEHRGLVMEFDTAEPSFQALGSLNKVEYLPSRPVYDPVEGAKSFWRQKATRWSYEREWRILRELDSCERHEVNGVSIYLCPISRASVKAVYLGCRTDAETELRIRGLVRNTSTVLYRAHIEGAFGNLTFETL